MSGGGKDGGPLLYTVEFDDGERLSDLTDEELTRLKSHPKAMPTSIQEELPYEAALKGPRAIKVDDRVRIWWQSDHCYDGVVTECETLLGVDCRPTLSFRVAYDDGDDHRHVLGDFPLEKLKQSTKRPEPGRVTRVTPRELSGKRTRDLAASAAPPASPGSPSKVTRRA